MGYEYGKDWRIKIGDGQATEAFDNLGGEGSFEFKRSSDNIDLSSKDDGAYKAQGYGQQSITISVTGKLKLPDVGLERVLTVSKGSPPEVNIKIMKGAIVKFAGRIGIGNFSLSAPQDGAIPYSFDMSAVSAPTVDSIAAAV